MHLKRVSRAKPVRYNLSRNVVSGTGEERQARECGRVRG